MSDYFGIDLGTTNSIIARIVDGRATPIPIDGNAIVPSIVLFDGGRVVVGREARNLELQYPERTIRSVKRKMGREHHYDIDGRQIHPEEVAAEVLRALKRGAEDVTGRTVSDVVITVPAYFDDGQRRATLRAGEIAGLNVLRLLNEPTAASLVYDRVGAEPGSEQPEIVLIYDLGGGTFDASVLEVFEGIREVRATAGNSALGGDDFDELLVRSFLDDLKREHRVDPREDARAMARLRQVAEEIKIRLSAETEVQVREEFLTERQGVPVHLEARMSRRRLEEMIRPLLQSTIELCRRAVDEARLAGQRVSRICLVGGSTRIPLVRELLSEAFDAEIREEIDPDLAVGLGASLQSGLLQGAALERILVDVAAHTLGVRVVGDDDIPGEEPDTFAPVLRKNTVLPGLRTQEFYTMVDGQQQIRVEVFQGEAARVSQNRFVGSFEFPLLPARQGTPIKIAFAYDLNGVVKVSISQAGTDNEKSVALSVADAGKGAQRLAQAVEVDSPPGSTAIERKARRLLAALAEQGDRRPAEVLEALLDRYARASGPARDEAEEAILDFFLDHEDDERGEPARDPRDAA